jgi:DNA polymerase III subunit delta'
MTFNLGPQPAADIEGRLAKARPDWNPRQRALVARLSEGAMGRALSFDLEGYVAARSHALIMLKSAIGTGSNNTTSSNNDHSELFKTTESYRAGAEGREKIGNLIRTLYSLLEDLMFLQTGAVQLVRNTDIMGELKKMSEATDFDWLERAAEGLGELERGLRRNLLRSLSLDAFVTTLERAS